MRVLYGSTRLVVLTKHNAIKIARFRILKALMWFLEFIFIKRQLESSRRGKSLIRIFVGITLSGLMSNWREWLYSKTKPDDKRIKPATKCLLFGMIIIQPRGEKAEKIDIPRGANSLFKKRIPRTDTCLSKQFAIFNENGVRKVLLIDFGGKITIEALLATYEQNKPLKS